jgi:hypothetical protein
VERVSDDRVGLDECYRPAGAADTTDESEALADRGRQVVDLELDRQHAHVGRHQRRRGETAGRVQARGDRAAVHEAVLLGEPGVERHLDLDFARGDAGHARAQHGHEPLPGERGAHAGLEERVRRLGRARIGAGGWGHRCVRMTAKGRSRPGSRTRPPPREA